VRVARWRFGAPRLANLNYIYFYADPKVSGSGFGYGLARLVAALNTDLGWIRDHTRLGAVAERWQTRKKDVALLLRGDELEDAERWLSRKPPNAPEPTGLLRAFLAESRRAEMARLDKERQQLAEIAAAQANIATEQTQRARSQRITRWVMAAAGALALVGSGIVAYLQWDKARQLATKEVALTESRQHLEKARADVAAEQASNAALNDSLNRRQIELDHAQANILAELSAAKLSRGDIGSALRLASSGTRIDLALPADITRASLAAAALAAAVFQTDWRLILEGHDDHVNSAAFSPDGSRIVTASNDKTARIWDAASAKEIAVLRGHDLYVQSAAFSPDGSRIVTASEDKTARIRGAHLQTMSAKDLLAEACLYLAQATKLTREEMRLAGYPDSMQEIDVCISGQ
jgi:WD domain, G-beta repeat